jgi:putative ABC transport system substrate-binding protein
MKGVKLAVTGFSDFAAATIAGMNDLFPRDGGLMSYSIDSLDTYRQGASYIDRILKGANPADLPVHKTAKELGLDVPVHLQQLADEVIE